MNKKLRQKGWMDMNQRLDAGMPKGRKRGLLIWWLFGAVIVIALVTGWVLMNQSLPQDSPENAATAQSESQFQATGEKEKTEVSPHELALSKSNARAQKIYAEKTNQSTFPEREPQAPVSESIPDPVNPHREQTDMVSNNTTSAPPLLAGPGLAPADTQVHSSAYPLPWIELSALPKPMPSDLSVAPLMKFSPPSADIAASSENVSGNGFFIDLSAGTRTVRSYSYVAQAGMGWRSSISNRWAYKMTTGLGINGTHQPAQVALKELQRSSLFQLDESIDNSSNQFSGIGAIPEAQLHLKNNYFAYLGTHFDYSIHDRWSVSMGMEVAYRFHSVHEGPTQQNPEVISNPTGGTSELRYSAGEIENRFVLFNRWDIRPVAGITYGLRPGLQLEFTYRHGVNPLLAHPIKGTPAGYARFLQFGVRYQIGTQHLDD